MVVTQDPEKIRKRQYDSMGSKQLIWELLNKTVTHTQGAIAAISQKDFDAANTHLIHAQEILLSLRDSILTEDAESESGIQVLDILLDHLFFANINKDVPRLEELLHILIRLASIAEEDRGIR